jgi:hypothetical protein
MVTVSGSDRDIFKDTRQRNSKSISLQEMIDNAARSLYGMTRAEAHALKICISCKMPVHEDEIDPVDVEEYYITGYCPLCFARTPTIARG